MNNSVTGVVTASKDLGKLSATNTIYAAQQTTDYDNDSFFFGTLTYDPTSPVLTV